MEYTFLFRQLTEQTRLRILLLLSHGPLCVCHIMETLEEPQAKISKQLSQLRRAKLLQVERVRNWSVYRLSNDIPPVLDAILESINQATACERLKQDLENLEALIRQLREDPGCCPLPLDDHAFLHSNNLKTTCLN